MFTFPLGQPQILLKFYFPGSQDAFCILSLYFKFYFGFFSFPCCTDFFSFPLPQTLLSISLSCVSFHMFRVQLWQGSYSLVTANAQNLPVSLLIKLLFPLWAKSLRIHLCQCFPNDCLHFYLWGQSTSLYPRWLKNIHYSSVFHRYPPCSLCLSAHPFFQFLFQASCFDTDVSVDPRGTFPPYASSVPNVIQMPWIPFQETQVL